MVEDNKLRQNSDVFGRWKQILLPPFQVASTAGQMPMDRGMQEVGGSVEATCDITLLLRNMCH